MFLDYFALGVLVFVGVTLFYGIIAVHDIPYEIAKSRNHPHQDAIHIAGWVSLFTLHVLWPFLWIWATLYRSDRGWGFAEQDKTEIDPRIELVQLKKRLARIEQFLRGENSEQRIAKDNIAPPIVKEKSASLQPTENP